MSLQMIVDRVRRGEATQHKLNISLLRQMLYDQPFEPMAKSPCSQLPQPEEQTPNYSQDQ